MCVVCGSSGRRPARGRWRGGGGADRLGLGGVAAGRGTGARGRLALLERRPRGVCSPRPAGRCSPTSDDILERSTPPRRHSPDLSDLRGGRLRLASFPTAGATIVPRAVDAFRRATRASRCGRAGDPGGSVDAAAHGRLDLALTLDLALRPNSGVEVLGLFDDPVQLALHRDHPLADRAAPRLGQLAGRPGSTSRETRPGRRRCSPGRAHAPGSARTAYLSDDYAGDREPVGAGVGIALIPELARRRAPSVVHAPARAGRAEPHDPGGDAARASRSPAATAMVVLLLEQTRSGASRLGPPRRCAQPVVGRWPGSTIAGRSARNASIGTARRAVEHELGRMRPSSEANFAAWPAPTRRHARLARGAGRPRSRGRAAGRTGRSASRARGRSRAANSSRKRASAATSPDRPVDPACPPRSAPAAEVPRAALAPPRRRRGSRRTPPRRARSRSGSGPARSGRARGVAKYVTCWRVSRIGQSTPSVLQQERAVQAPAQSTTRRARSGPAVTRRGRPAGPWIARTRRPGSTVAPRERAPAQAAPRRPSGRRGCRRRPGRPPRAPPAGGTAASGASSPPASGARRAMSCAHRRVVVVQDRGARPCRAARVDHPVRGPAGRRTPPRRAPQAS